MSFLWHDYETFGTNAAYDRPVQFAARRTDEALAPVGEPVTWFARPADDTLPHPFACLVTGITPQHAWREGVPEAEFAGRIHALMMEPGTCSVGYNSLRFDDQVSRFLFYRNFIDAYEREYRNGNSRWDLIDLVRMCYALRPEGLNWPEREPGVPSFRLEDLTAANGIEHSGAHDALVDVNATIDLARRLREAQPRLFAWALEMRDRTKVTGLLDTVRPRPLLHTTSRIPAARGCTSLVLPLATVPDRPKEVIAMDLMGDMEPLLELDAADIRDRVFTPSADLPEGVERIPLKTIGTNKVPMLAPAATLKGADPERIGLDVERCRENARQLLERLDGLRPKLMEVFLPPSPEPGGDPDGQLYGGGFFSNRDRAAMNRILSTPPEQLGALALDFEDPRLPEMLFRYRARNYPDTLDAGEAERWEVERLERLHSGAVDGRLDAETFYAELAQARAAQAGHPGHQALLDQVEAWAEKVLGNP